MTGNSVMDDTIRAKIIADPEALLEDHDIMRALVSANETAMGTNVVDLRGIAMERLTSRLDRLEDTHRSVIAAAYENLAGTNQIHRAVLRIMDATEFETFLADLRGDVAEILRVDALRLLLESESQPADGTLGAMGATVLMCPPGLTRGYMTGGRNTPVRQVTLRQMHGPDERIYGEKAAYLRSEACLTLDFGPGKLPGMLVLAAEDPHLFTPQQGTDLLTFFAGTFERVMRRWLA